MRKTLIAGFAILALSFGVAACGSDDSGDTASEETLTKTELIAQADEICAARTEELRTMSDNAFESEPTDQQVAEFIEEEIVPHYEGEIDELRALNPDEESAAEWNEILDTLESELQTVKDDPEAAVDFEDPFEESSAAAKAFGLKSCGQAG